MAGSGRWTLSESAKIRPSTGTALVFPEQGLEGLDIALGELFEFHLDRPRHGIPPILPARAPKKVSFFTANHFAARRGEGLAYSTSIAQIGEIAVAGGSSTTRKELRRQDRGYVRGLAGKVGRDPEANPAGVNLREGDYTAQQIVRAAASCEVVRVKAGQTISERDVYAYSRCESCSISVMAPGSSEREPIRIEE